jgi:hypothetical protein
MALKFDMSRNQFTDAMYQQMAMEQQQALGKNIGESLGLLGKAWSDDYSKQGKAFKKYVREQTKLDKPALSRQEWRDEFWKNREDKVAFKDRAIPSALRNLNLRDIYTGKDQEKGLSGLVGNIKGMSGKEKLGLLGTLAGAGGLSLFAPGVAGVAGIGMLGDKRLSKMYGKDYIEQGKQAIGENISAARHALGEKVQGAKESIVSAPKSILQRVMDKRDERKAKRLEAKIAKTDASLPSLETDATIPAYQTLEDGTLAPMSYVPSDGFETVPDQESTTAETFLRYSPQEQIQSGYKGKVNQSQLRRKLGLRDLPPNLQSRRSILLSPDLLKKERSAQAQGFQGYGQYLYPDANKPLIQSQINPGFNLGDY